MASVNAAHEPRIVNPRDPLDKQIEILNALISRPPENSRVLTIMPPLAAHILEKHNTHNRKKRPAKIARWAQMMAIPDGWVLTGDTVKFGTEGTLLDGQNRLSACVQSNCAFRTHVVFGIDGRAFAVIDNNAVRSNPDTFEIAGVPNSQTAAQAVRWLMIYENDPQSRGVSFENTDVLEYWRTKVDSALLNNCVSKAKAAGRNVPPGSLAAHLYMFAKQGPRRVWDQLVADIETSSRGYLSLKRKVEKSREANMGRIHETAVNAWMIQMWHGYKKDERVTKATFTWNDAKPYPKI